MYQEPNFTYYRHTFQIAKEGTVSVDDLTLPVARAWVKKRFSGKKVTHIKTITN